MDIFFRGTATAILNRNGNVEIRVTAFSDTFFTRTTITLYFRSHARHNSKIPKEEKSKQPTDSYTSSENTVDTGSASMEFKHNKLNKIKKIKEDPLPLPGDTPVVEYMVTSSARGKTPRK